MFHNIDYQCLKYDWNLYHNYIIGSTVAICSYDSPMANSQ